MSGKDVEHKSGLEKEMQEVDFSPDASGPADGRRRSSWARKGSLARSEGWQKRDAFASVSAGKEGDGADESNDNDINYQTLAWWQTAFIMFAETVSLGILSLPSVLAEIGMAPGVILILVMGVIAWYTGWIIGKFKLQYPWIQSWGDIGEILFEPLGPRWAAVGREVLGTGQLLLIIFTMASHVLVWTIGFNTITNGGTCTIVFAIIGTFVFWLCTLPRTLKGIAPMAIVSFISIFTAVMITMVGTGITKPGGGKISATKTAAFPDAFLSFTNIIFAYTGHVGFPGFLSEMKNPAEWPKALTILQVSDTTLYIIAAAVIYWAAGDEVKSPALGSASTVVSKVAWGVAIPTIIIAGVILGHVASQYLFVRIFRGTKYMGKRNFVATASWLAITASLWFIAFVLAESIPDFNTLLALIASLFASWFTFGLQGFMWFNMNRGRMFDGAWQIAGFCIAIFNIAIGFFICIAGVYASAHALASSGGNIWTCESNAE